MSSDIWRPHPHYHPNHQQLQQKQQHNLTNSISGRNKRSRSVLAMPNQSSELSARQTTQLKLGEQNNLTSRRPTYSGPISTATATTGNNHEMQQQQQLSMEEDLIDGQQQQVSGKHAGPMGIFFKVWSLVKVTKGRHQQRQQQRQLQQHQQHQTQIQNGAHSRLRRQASEDNSNYSADFPLSATSGSSSSRQVNILQDKHFRRAGSQPASSLVDRLQVRNSTAAANTTTTTTTTTTGSSCTSSGVSSTTSSTLAANSGNSPTTSSSSSPFQRRSFGGGAGLAMQQQQQQKAAAKEQQESWASKMRGSNRARATSAAAAAIARRRNSGQQQLLSLSLSTSDGSRSSSELRDEPEEYENELDEAENELGEDEEEEESNDIYSTPNDSIQSVPSGQRALNSCNSTAANERQTFNPMSKSFSTNNFHQLHQQTNSKPAAERLQDNSDKKQQRPTLNGSRFFISSSSSEDSQPTKQPVQQQAQAPTKTDLTTQQQQTAAGVAASGKQRVSLNQGVHTHLGPARPHSLLLSEAVVYGQDPAISQFLVPVQMLTPLGGGAAPSTAAAAAANVYLGTRLRSPAIVATGYQRSPSLFEFPQNTRFSSKYPPQVSSFQQQQQQQQLKLGRAGPAPPGGPNLSQSRQSVDSNSTKFSIPNSISMFDFKQANNNNNANTDSNSPEQTQPGQRQKIEERSEYKLAEMMLESGSNPNARDQQGNTTLMLACLSDNLSAVKCLIEHGANLNDTNLLGLGALDLVCMRQADSIRLEMLKILVDNGVDLDRQSTSDGSRLLDRLIKEHQSAASASWSPQDRMAYIECLLESGAKLSSSTWAAARGKLEVQLCLLRKLCQDGYFLYKQGSIEAAVYRFEYALKRIAELEQQLAWLRGGRRQSSAPSHLQPRSGPGGISPESASLAGRKIKYQTYLGLSRCERKRKFYKRALEFAQLAILVDSSSYEAFYSKAHILKDLNETDDSLLTIDQTARLIERTIENLALELKYLDQQEESLIMDNCFGLDRESCRQQANLLARGRLEIQGTVDYLLEARKYVAKLRQDIMGDKFRSSSQNRITTNNSNSDSNTNNANNNKEAILST